MNTWQAMATLMAARDGVENYESLEFEARETLRKIGMREEEIDDDFPEEVVQRGLNLIYRNPEQFRKECREAVKFMAGRN